MTNIKPNFIYPEITEQDRVFGAGLIGEVINPSGDWRPFLPPDEVQNVDGVESSACYIEAQQATIATLLEQQFSVPDSNFSARFNALLSNGTEVGGDPVKGAKSIKFDGLVPEEMMSWKNVESWEDYHSWKWVDMSACKSTAKAWLKDWTPSFKILVEKELPLETKYTLLREELKRSPVPVSVYAWIKKGEEYYKPAGLRDTHLTLATFVDEQNRIHVRDTYAPHYKVLAPNTDFEFAMGWVVKPNTGKDNWLIDLIKRLLSIFT